MGGRGDRPRRPQAWRGDGQDGRERHVSLRRAPGHRRPADDHAGGRRARGRGRRRRGRRRGHRCRGGRPRRDELHPRLRQLRTVRARHQQPVRTRYVPAEGSPAGWHAPLPRPRPRRRPNVSARNVFGVHSGADGLGGQSRQERSAGQGGPGRLRGDHRIRQHDPHRRGHRGGHRRGDGRRWHRHQRRSSGQDRRAPATSSRWTQSSSSVRGQWNSGRLTRPLRSKRPPGW